MADGTLEVLPVERTWLRWAARMLCGDPAEMAACVTPQYSAWAFGIVPEPTEPKAPLPSWFHALWDDERLSGLTPELYTRGDMFHRGVVRVTRAHQVVTERRESPATLQKLREDVSRAVCRQRALWRYAPGLNVTGGAVEMTERIRCRHAYTHLCTLSEIIDSTPRERRLELLRLDAGAWNPLATRQLWHARGLPDQAIVDDWCQQVSSRHAHQTYRGELR